MAVKPNMVKANYESMKTSDIVNTVRERTALGEGVTSINFKERLPECTQANLQDIYNILDGDSDFANAFLKELFNRVGLVDMNYRRYKNGLRGLKRGRLEFGESIEEIAFGLVKGKCDYNPEDGVVDVFKLSKEEVGVALHRVNFQQKYPLSITRAELRKAFTSESSLGSFIDGYITGLYNSYEIDEQLAYKNLIGEVLRTGGASLIEIDPVVDEATGKSFIKLLKSISTKMRFLSGSYNAAGFPQFTPETDLMIIIDAVLDASISVDVWAAAFNMSQVDFLDAGVKIVIDEFPVDGVHALVCDRRFFMILDNDFSLDAIYNPSNRVWNYFLHVWEVISASPFAQAVIFADKGSGSVTGVNVTPGELTMAKGSSKKFKAQVEGTGAMSGKVTWSVSGGTASTITPTGVLSVGTAETATTLTVTATSDQTEGISGTATVTIS